MSLIRRTLAVVTCAFLLVNSSGTVQAQQPDGVIRTFMVLDLVDENVDFGGEDSVLLKVNNSSSPPVVRTFAPGLGQPFHNANFGFGVSAMYITRGMGQTPVGVFGWLLDEDTPEPPPAGSVALLGRDVVILQTETFYWYPSGSSIYTTSDDSESAGTIVTALFTK